jgi:hypothetical protein
MIPDPLDQDGILGESEGVDTGEDTPVDENQMDAPPAESAKGDNEPVDDRGVPWKNRAYEERRKREKLQRRLDSIEQRLATMAAPAPAPAPKPATQTNPLRDLTDVQKKAAFGEWGFEVTKLMIDEAVDRARNEERAVSTKESRINALRARAAQRAVDRFPDLNDTSSDFYDEVNTAYAQREAEYREAGIETAPDLLLVVAQDVADSGKYDDMRRGSQKSDDWDTISRRRAADRGTPPPTSRKATSTSDVPELPPLLKRALQTRRGGGTDPAKFAKFLEQDEISKTALRRFNGEED